MSSMRIVMRLMPLILMLLSIPIILGKVPRNHWYGFRTPYTLSSDEVWYRANKICGVAVLLASVVWLVVGWVLPLWMGATVQTYRLVQILGLVWIGVALAVSAWLVYRR